ncbi:MAG: DegT/DnrJ/EryC1/StrS family aminotransferase [Bacteroidetes bacterium]|nr:DegT/DnrJ/EryC1/StrS family aminotransferase [Bacteroidota bacterium]
MLVPSNTYIATWLAVSQTGAMPVPVEPDTITRNITVEGLKKAITLRTKAIIPVHLYGLMCPMESIMDYAEIHKLSGSGGLCTSTWRNAERENGR